MKGIVIMMGQSDSGALVTNYLKEHVPILAVIQEEKEPKKRFLKRRLKSLGWWKLFGQLCFMAIIPKLLKAAAAKRIAQIQKTYDLKFERPADLDIYAVESVNSNETREILASCDADLILVIGTRIIGKKTLSGTSAPFLNVHVGLTPLFRGVHGGYWALATKKKFGTTIHYIDEGIDTGKVVVQKISQPDSKDNFLTYPYLQMAEILAPLKEAILELSSGKSMASKAIYSESKLWSHPTLREYLFNYFKFGVK